MHQFSLDFINNCAHFPFIFNGKPVTSTGKYPAPSCLISSRETGDMVFRLPNKNREAFFSSQKIPAEKVYSLFQVHSRDVFTLGSPANNSSVMPLPAPEDFAREGDGIVSFSPDVFLAATVADCLPVFLLDTENGFFAALHSGWKGTGIVLKALNIMQQAGTRPGAVAAVLGPCIQNCCYKVDEGRAKNFQTEFGSASNDYFHSDFPLEPVSRKDHAGWYINLQAANARLLSAAGVQHIACCTDCTFTDTRFGSYRREGAEAHTRMLAVVGNINHNLPLR